MSYQHTITNKIFLNFSHGSNLFNCFTVYIVVVFDTYNYVDWVASSSMQYFVCVH